MPTSACLNSVELGLADAQRQLGLLVKGVVENIAFEHVMAVLRTHRAVLDHPTDLAVAVEDPIIELALPICHQIRRPPGFGPDHVVGMNDLGPQHPVRQKICCAIAGQRFDLVADIVHSKRRFGVAPIDDARQMGDQPGKIETGRPGRKGQAVALRGSDIALPPGKIIVVPVQEFAPKPSPDRRGCLRGPERVTAALNFIPVTMHWPARR